MNAHLTTDEVDSEKAYAKHLREVLELLTDGTMRLDFEAMIDALISDQSQPVNLKYALFRERAARLLKDLEIPILMFFSQGGRWWSENPFVGDVLTQFPEVVHWLERLALSKGFDVERAAEAYDDPYGIVSVAWRALGNGVRGARQVTIRRGDGRSLDFVCTPEDVTYAIVRFVNVADNLISDGADFDDEFFEALLNTAIAKKLIDISTRSK